MTQLICMGDGTYTFGSTEALKEFLSIDGECVANAKTALCKNRRMNVVKKMEPQFEKVVSDGFPSDMTALKLREVAKTCICWRHESQHNDIYDDWTRRLWVAYLEKNGVGNIPVDSETPALEDKEKWKEVLRQLKRQPPAQAADTPVPERVPSAIDLDDVHPPTRRFSMRKRVSTLTNRSIKRASSNFSTMTKLQRKLTAPRSSGEGHGLGDIVKRLFGFGRRDDPDEPSPECRHETRETSTVGDEPTVSSPLGPLEICDPVLEDVPEPRAVATETQTHNRFTTPIKRRKPEDDLARGVPGAFYESDDSPAPSSLSSGAASPFSSPDESNLHATPDTTFSSDFEFKTPATSPPNRQSGTPDRSDPVDTVTLSPRHDEEDPITFNSAKSRASGADSSFIPRSNFSMDFKPDSRNRKRPPRAASHHLETPTKTRAAPRDVVPSSDEDEDEDEDEGEGEELGEEDDEGEGEQLDTPRHLHFEPYRKARNAMQFRSQQFAALKNLLKLLERPILTEKKRAGGYIYIFKRNTAPEYLKIGQSKHPHGKRMEEFSKKCDYGATFVKEWYIDEAVSVIEVCVDYHLEDCRFWDMRCKATYGEKMRARSEGDAEPCKKGHKEWFKTSKERVTEVVAFWRRFLGTRPFVNGRLTAFWRNEMVRMWDDLGSWQRDGSQPFVRWSNEMKAAMTRCETDSQGNPTVELSLRVRVTCEGDETVLKVLDETRAGGAPLLTRPMLPGPERV